MRRFIDSAGITDRIVKMAHEANSNHGTTFRMLAKNYGVNSSALKEAVEKYRRKNKLAGYVSGEDLRARLRDPTRVKPGVFKI